MRDASTERREERRSKSLRDEGRVDREERGEEVKVAEG